MIPPSDPDAEELSRLATAWEHFKDALPVRIAPRPGPPPTRAAPPRNRAERRAAARRGR